MKYSISDALQSLKPGAIWTLRGDEYSGLEWQDSSQTKPTETEVTNKITALDATEPMRLLRVERDKRKIGECYQIKHPPMIGQTIVRHFVIYLQVQHLS